MFVACKKFDFENNLSESLKKVIPLPKTKKYLQKDDKKIPKEPKEKIVHPFTLGIQKLNEEYEKTKNNNNNNKKIKKSSSPPLSIHSIKKQIKRCPNGTRRNKKTGNCEKKNELIIVKNKKTDSSEKEKKITYKRCPNGTRRNKKTGNCEKNK